MCKYECVYWFQKNHGQPCIICVISNLISQTVPSIDNHQFIYWYHKNHPYNYMCKYKCDYWFQKNHPCNICVSISVFTGSRRSQLYYLCEYKSVYWFQKITPYYICKYKSVYWYQKNHPCIIICTTLFKCTRSISHNDMTLFNIRLCGNLSSETTFKTDFNQTWQKC